MIAKAMRTAHERRGSNGSPRRGGLMAALWVRLSENQLNVLERQSLDWRGEERPVRVVLPSPL
jgi:hypothetical protein